MLPSLYHAHNSRNPEDLPFWLDLAQRTGDPILELGCGTGRVIIPLVDEGHLVYGLDNDLEMLRFLESNTPSRLAPSIRLVQGDMSAFALGIKFPLIILPCNTYTTLPAQARFKTLQCVKQHLLPGGVFAMSMPSPSFLRQLPRYAEPDLEEIFPHPVDREPVQVSSAWKRTSRSVAITWIYDHLHADGEVERSIYNVVQHIIPDDAIEGELHRAGLDITAAFGDFNRSPYTDESTYLILTAQEAED